MDTSIIPELTSNGHNRNIFFEHHRCVKGNSTGKWIETCIGWCKWHTIHRSSTRSWDQTWWSRTFSVKIGLKPGNRSTWESHECSGTQWEQFINTETNLLAWNTMRAVEELSLCPGIVEGAQNAAITEELYRRSPRRQKKRKKKLQVQPCIGWSSNYWSYGLGKKCYRVLEYYRVHI